MAVWVWMLIAAGAGALIGLEAWAWMRHRMSALVLLLTGALSVGIWLGVIGLVAALGLGAVAGFTGWDRAGLSSTTTNGSGERCDANYEDSCLSPNASDYDCAGGSGDGPEYAGTVSVVGVDVYGLDHDGDGVGCE